MVSKQPEFFLQLFCTLDRLCRSGRAWPQILLVGVLADPLLVLLKANTHSIKRITNLVPAAQNQPKKIKKKLEELRFFKYFFLKNSDIKWHFDLVIYCPEFTDVAQSFEYQSGVLLMRVQIPTVAKDFPPKVNFETLLRCSYRCCVSVQLHRTLKIPPTHPQAIHTHNTWTNHMLYDNTKLDTNKQTNNNKTNIPELGPANIFSSQSRTHQVDRFAVHHA